MSTTSKASQRIAALLDDNSFVDNIIKYNRKRLLI